MTKPNVLVVDDDAAMCALLATRLGTRGFVVETSTDPAQALAAVERDVAAVVTDINMKGMNGLELCRRIHEQRPGVPVIVITAFGTMDAAIQAIRSGAYDFLPKPFEIDQLALALERGIAHARLTLEVSRLRRELADTQGFSKLLGKSASMRDLSTLIAKVADSSAPVLITGESGTGKELVARELHDRSTRRDGPFVAVNCAAMPEALLESELFGHVKGAFTDARSAKRGLFQAADGGTIFLDEIGELPLGLQPKLLRALQEKKVRPIGATAEVTFDARVVTATNRDLEGMVEERTFREDLFFRINVIQLMLPPLRARGGDVLLLAQHFLARSAERDAKGITGFAPAAAERLMAYAWPGNVRELQNTVESAVALASYDHITVDDLPERVKSHRGSHATVGTDDTSELVSLEEVERRYVTRVIEAVGGNKSAAARVLRIERKTLYRMMERWGLDPK